MVNRWPTQCVRCERCGRVIWSTPLRARRFLCGGDDRPSASARRAPLYPVFVGVQRLPYTRLELWPSECGSGGTADALASGASWSNPVGVRIPPSAPAPNSFLNGRFRGDRRRNVLHNGWRAFAVLVQLLCNGVGLCVNVSAVRLFSSRFRRPALLQLLHRQMQAASMDVQVSARRAQVRVTAG